MAFDDKYPFIVQEVLKHIELIKSSPSGKDTALLDIIYDFCFKNKIDVEVVGDAISSDVYFKSFIQKDCEMHRILKSDVSTELENW